MGLTLDLGGASQVEVRTVAAGDDEFLDGAGDSTSTYNDTSGDDDTGVTFIKTGLGRLDDVSATVEADPVTGTGATVARASPAADAVADDIDELEDGEEDALVLLELYDANDGTELAEADVSGLEVTVTAVRR